MTSLIESVKASIGGALQTSSSSSDQKQSADSKLGTMVAMRFSRKDGPLEEHRISIPIPGKEEVRIKIYAAGVCATDHFTQHNVMNISYPRVPGHEVAGKIDAVGEEVKGFSVGDRVGVGWTAYYCGRCNCCRDSNTACCEKVLATGNNVDGGYQEYMICHYSGLARIPEDMTFVEAAPMMDAALTVFNGLRHSVARANDLVAIVGIGGLGHLAIQFANKMGFRVAAVSHSADKKQDCLNLGAHYFIDSTTEDAGQELNRLGGAKVIMIVATTNDAKLYDSLAQGIMTHGQVMLVTTLLEPTPITALNLLVKRGSIFVWNTGDAKDIEDTMQFALMHDIHPIVEVFPLREAAKAYERCQNSDARYRAVLQVRKE